MEPKRSWEQRALCKKADREIFFARKLKRREAIDVCLTCPVRSLCLMYALAHNESGVWGGTTDLERDAISDLKEYAKDQYALAGLLESRLQPEIWYKASAVSLLTVVEQYESEDVESPLEHSKTQLPLVAI